MKHYMAYGLAIASDRTISGLPEVAPTRPPDLVVRDAGLLTDQAEPDGAVLAHVHEPPYLDRTFLRRRDGSYLLRFRGLCDFEIDAKLQNVAVRRVEQDNQWDVSAAEGAELLLAGAIPSFVLAMLGHVVLHASAVAWEGRAVAFVGQSGQGKSTMAALLCGAGASLITDDALRLDRNESAYLCRLGAGGLRLRKLADELSDHYSAPPEQYESPDGRTVLEPARIAEDALPLAAIVIPLPVRDRAELEIHRLSAPDAGLALLSYPRLVGWEDPDVLARQLDQTMTLAEAVPCFTAAVPWGPPFARKLAGRLIRRVLDLPES